MHSPHDPSNSFVVLTCMYICICNRAGTGALRFAAPLNDLSGGFFEIRSDNIGLAKNVVEDKVLFVRDESRLESAHARELSAR